jgi:hypothetical protein
MFEKISYTWEVMGASWRVLRQDKEMLLFPLLSGIGCLLVSASFAVPLFAGKMPDFNTDNVQGNVLYYVGAFLFYFVNYFVITFFNTALIACAVKRLRGGDPTFSEGLSEALARVHLIFGWALISATVGVILRVIQDKAGKLGQLAAGLLGFAWTLLSYLAIPVLVVENKGPIDALKESASLLRRTWGEQLIGNFSFGVIFFLLNIPAIVAIIGGIIFFMQQQIPLGITLIAIGALYLLVVSLVQSALQAIFQAAVYLYAANPQDPQVTRGFPVQLASSAISPK